MSDNELVFRMDGRTYTVRGTDTFVLNLPINVVQDRDFTTGSTKIAGSFDASVTLQIIDIRKGRGRSQDRRDHTHCRECGAVQQ